jgi:L-ascorbate metabolism protein UlaG (beta-lactamase superfamily)
MLPPRLRHVPWILHLAFIPRRFIMLVLTALLLLLGATSSVEVIPITHGSLILKGGGKVIHVDPWSRGNYEGQPAADLVLVTDTHGDHLDAQQIVAVSKADTVVVAPAAVQKAVSYARVLNNGESTTVSGIGVEAVPMYNLKRGPEEGKLYHTKGRGNGYILTIGEHRVYISGDTACTPEMKALKNIEIAFVSMNLPYTMTPEEAAECVNTFKPKVVYPYHYRGSDLETFRAGVTAEGVEVRLAKWY